MAKKPQNFEPLLVPQQKSTNNFIAQVIFGENPIFLFLY